MTKEQVKQRLNRYHHIQMERRQILDRIMRLEDRLTAPGAQNFDGMPHASGSGDTMARSVAALVDLRKLYKEKEIELTQALVDIEHLIANLEPVERMIARYRYIDRMHWEQICVKISYSWRQTHRIHSDMIDKLANELEEAEVKASEAMRRLAQAVSPLKLGRMNGRHDGYNPVFVSIDELDDKEEKG